MNDDKLITRMKEPFADVHMTMPLDQVVRQGRAVQARRLVRRRLLTGAVALAGGAAAVVALLPVSGRAHPAPGGHPGTTELAAWTVTRDPDGGITVTVNQMTDPAGLQATLRADGIPARVTFDPLAWLTQPLPAGCTAPNMSGAANAQLQSKILQPPAIWAWHQQQRQRIEHTPITITYTLNGHAGRAMVTRSGLVWVKKMQQLRKEGAEDINVTGPGMAGPPMPRNLQKLQEKTEGNLYINPAAIPAGIGLSIGVDIASAKNYSYGVDLAVTSPQCTGS